MTLGFHPDWFVHSGYLLMLAALLARDILWLRGLLVCAQSNLALYAWTHGLPGMTFWNALFVLINTLWVLRILQQRRAIRLPPALAAIQLRHFAALSSQEFMAFWCTGNTRRGHDQRLLEEGVHPAELLFLVQGEARVLSRGRAVARLPAGSFVGEMSLLTGEPTTAAVDAVGAFELQAWPVAGLQEIRLRQPLLWTRLQSALGHDLIEKLKRAALIQELPAQPVTVEDQHR
jgi:hypothetical protein